MWYSLNCKAGNQSDSALNFFWKQPIPKAKENMRDGLVFLKVSTDIPATMGISLSTNSVIPLLYWNLTGANIFGDFIKGRAVFITGQNVMLEHSRSPNISLLFRSWLILFVLVTCWKAWELSVENELQDDMQENFSRVKPVLSRVRADVSRVAVKVLLFPWPHCPQRDRMCKVR